MNRLDLIEIMDKGYDLLNDAPENPDDLKDKWSDYGLTVYESTGLQFNIEEK